MARKHMTAKLLLTATAGAAVLGLSPQAYAAACASGTLTTYLVAGFTCTEGDKTFSGFSYTPSSTGGAPTEPASAVTVVPNTAAPTAFGFTFDSNWAVSGANNSSGATLGYTVAVTTGTALITGATSTMAALITSASGSASVNEMIGGNPLNVNASNPPGSLTNSITFPGVTDLSITKNIVAAVGAGGDVRTFAQITSISDTVAQTTPSSAPEPASLALLSTALAGLGIWGWRRRKTGARAHHPRDGAAWHHGAPIQRHPGRHAAQV
jgi:hypothetical protein